MTDSVTKYTNKAYPGDFLKGMMTQRQNEQFIDVELESDDVHILCHKNVLAATSRYFNAMFTSGMRESSTRVVHIELDSASLRSVVDYFYTAEIEFTEDNVRRLVEASDLFQLDDLNMACGRFMLGRLTSANCVGVFNFASLYRLQQLQEGARRMMLDEVKAVVSASEFKDLSCQEVIKYLSDDGINVEDEDFVFESVLVWVRNDPDIRKSSLKQILDIIRLPYCTATYLHRVVNTCDVLTPECREYVREATKYHREAALRQEISSCRMASRTLFRMNRRLLVVGGEDNKHCHYMKKDDGFWEMLTDLPESRNYHSVCRVEGGLLLTGGLPGVPKFGSLVLLSKHNCWTYEFVERKWNPMPPFKIERHRHSSIVMGDTVYVIGGFENNTYKVIRSVESLDVRRRHWSSVPDLPQPVYHPMVTSLGDRLFVFGGRGADKTSLCCTQMYDTVWGEWRTLASMPELCDLGCAVTVNSHIYLVGGYKRSCLRYDPTADSWTSLSQPKLLHGLAPAVVWHGRILVAGGIGDDKNSSSAIEVYDCEKDQWSDWVCELKTPLSSHFVFNVDLYAVA